MTEDVAVKMRAPKTSGQSSAKTAKRAPAKPKTAAKTGPKTNSVKAAATAKKPAAKKPAAKKPAAPKKPAAKKPATAKAPAKTAAKATSTKAAPAKAAPARPAPDAAKPDGLAAGLSAAEISAAFGVTVSESDFAAALEAVEAAMTREPRSRMATEDALALYFARRLPVAAGLGRTGGKGGYAPRHLQLGVRDSGAALFTLMSGAGLSGASKLVLANEFKAGEEDKLNSMMARLELPAASLEIIDTDALSAETARRAGRFRFVSAHFDVAPSFLDLHRAWFLYAPRVRTDGYVAISGYRDEKAQEVTQFVDNVLLPELAEYWEPVFQTGRTLVLRKLDDIPEALVKSLTEALPMSAVARNMEWLHGQLAARRRAAGQMEEEIADRGHRLLEAQNEIAVVKARIEDMQDVLTTAEGERDGVKAELETAQAAREALQSEIEAAETKLAKTVERLELDLRIARNATRDREVELVQTQEKLRAQGPVQSELRQRIEDLQGRLKSAESQLATGQARQLDDTTALAKAQEQLSQAETARQGVLERVAVLEEKLDSAAESREASAVAAAQASERASALEAMKANAEGRIEDLKTELAGQAAARREADEALARAHNDISALQRSVQSASRELDELQDQLKGSEAVRLDVEARLNDEQSARESVERDLAALQASSEKEIAEAQEDAETRIAEAEAAAQDELETAREELKALREKLEGETRDLREIAEAGKAEAERRAGKAEEALAQITSDHAELQTKLHVTDERLAEFETEVKFANAERLDSLKQSREELDAAKAEYKEQRRMAQTRIAELERKLRADDIEAERKLNAQRKEFEGKLKEQSLAAARSANEAEKLKTSLSKAEKRAENAAAQARETKQASRQLEARADMMQAQMMAPRILLSRLFGAGWTRTLEKLATVMPFQGAKQGMLASAKRLRLRSEMQLNPAPLPRRKAVTVPDVPDMHDAGPARHDRTFFVNYTFGGKTRYLHRHEFLRHTTRAGQALGRLKGLFEGERCFVIGNGPSLNQQNLFQLEEEFTIGANYIYMNYDKMGFYPTILSFANYLVIQQRIDEILALDEPVKMLPFYLFNEFGAPKNTLLPNMQHQTPQFSTDATNYMSTQSTITYVNLQLAYYLGFDKVFLIGVDNRYKQPERGVEGTVLTQEEDDPNHFTPNYFKGLKWQKGDEVRIEYLYSLAKHHFEERGSKVVDCTHNGALTIYEKDNLDTVLRASPPPPPEKIDRAKKVMRAVTENPESLDPKRVMITVSPDLFDRFGHHFNMDQYLRREAHSRGEAFVSICSDQLEQELADECNWLIPAIPTRTWWSLRDQTVIQRKVGEFRQGVAKAMKVIDLAFGPDTPKTLYMYTGNLPLARALRDELAGRQDVEIVVHHFYAAMLDMEDPEIRQESERAIAELTQSGVKLVLGTEELVDYYAKKTGHKLKLLPGDPSCTFSDEDVEEMMANPDPVRTPVGGVFRTFFPPNMNIEKGYPVALGAARRISEDNRLKREFRPVLRYVPRPSTDPGVLTEAEALKDRPELEFIEGVLSDDDFRKVTRSADIIAITYTVEAFERRMSGSLVDAILCAKPIVGTRNTYVGNRIERYDCGATFEDGDVDSLVAALQKVAGNYEHYLRNAQKARRRFFEERAWRTIYREVFGK